MVKGAIQDTIKNNGINYVRFQFTDIFGSLRGLEIPTKLFDKYLEEGLGIDGSSVGFLSAESSDLKLKPDPHTFQVLPWSPKVAKITCNVSSSDGSEYSADPRTILQKQLKLIENNYWKAEVRPELEYYILNKDGSHIPSSSWTTNYMDLDPFDPYARLRREIVDYCMELGMNVKYAHAEVGPGQQEIEMGFVNPLQAADEISMMKQIIRIVASKENLIATFLPKPFSGEAGNGLHIHQRLLTEEKTSLFGNEQKFTDEGRYYVGGLLAHAPALTAFYNPITNSYKRMVPGHEAPVYLSWGIGNRTALVRVPGYEKSNRVEFRSADGASNIYLILALQLASGLDGIKNKIEPYEPISLDVTKMSQEDRRTNKIGQLPDSLWSALETMQQDPLVTQVVGEELVQIFLQQKQKEWAEYTAGRYSVTEWEFREFINYA
ncbi:MAG: glutamine synthetase family protein [Candidatus Hodarchaeales archaeon]|jgi:glutamine synthetase